jgi:hypothetical protein
MGETAAGGGDGAAGVEVNPFGKNAEGFFDFVVARPKGGRGTGATIPPPQRAQERRALGTPVPLRMTTGRM